MLIEITTNGFVAEPVLWQTSTFSPGLDEADAELECAVFELTWFELDWPEVG